MIFMQTEVMANASMSYSSIESEILFFASLPNRGRGEAGGGTFLNLKFKIFIFRYKNIVKKFLSFFLNIMHIFMLLYFQKYSGGVRSQTPHVINLFLLWAFGPKYMTFKF